MDVEVKVRQIMEEQLFGVLCTGGSGQPYGSLIGFALEDSMKVVYFATGRATRKYSLILEDRHVAMLIDSRSQSDGNMMSVESVTLTGEAEELESAADVQRAKALLLEKLPQLGYFYSAPTTAIIRINVARYFHVERFQEVTEWRP